MAARRRRPPMNAEDKHPKPRMIGTTATDFSSPVYWDVRYQRQREADGPDYTYEWYCDLDMVQTHLQMVFTDYDAPRILVLGCGNSKLSELIYNNGHADITNVDFSSVVIKDMKDRYRTYEGMLFFVSNITDLSFFPENNFDIIIDKGCLDCVFSMLDGARSAIKACKEVFRILSPKGRYLLYSCASPEARLTHFKADGLRWDVQGIYVGGTACAYYYIMKTQKKYSDSTALAHGREKLAIQDLPGAGEEESKRENRRGSTISTASFGSPRSGSRGGWLGRPGGARPGGNTSPKAGTSQRDAIIKNLRRLSLTKSKR